MSLTSVKIGEEVWLTCLSHALTTETEEVMGLLLGDVEVRRTPQPNLFQSFLLLSASHECLDRLVFSSNGIVVPFDLPTRSLRAGAERPP